MKNRIFSYLFSRLPLSYLFFIFLTFFAASVASAQIPSSGLVGYWPFNGNANDESGNGNNGTVNGATLTTDRFGNASSAYNFDGVNDFIDAGNFYNFGAANFTVSCWFKLVPTSANASLVSKREVNMQGNWWVQEVNGFQIDESAQSSILTLTHPTPLNKQLWTNYIIIREGNILSFYVNGVLSDQETLPTAYNMSNNANLLFGTTFVDGSYVGLLKGKLDDISIYNRAIDSEEISSLFTTTTSTVATPPCPTLATNLQTGLVGYWPFCGNANDESGNGNNGTVNGATLTTDRFGNANSAYSFDGGGTISIPHNPNLGFMPNDEFTASFWFYTINSTFPQHFMGKRPYNSNVFNWQFLSGTNWNTPEYSFASGLAVNTYSGAFAYQNLDVGQWVHLTGVYNNGNWKLYRNGVQIAETQNVLASNDVVCNLLFGNSGNFQPFFGKLDDISIYNRALTPSEITQLYTNPTTTPPVACTPFLGEDQTVCAGTSVTISASGSSLACPTLPSTLQNGLVGYWPFCGNANDASGNGNNGTVNGATLATDRFGNANSAYSFDGVDDVISAPRLNLSSFSVSAWVHPATADCFIPVVDAYPNSWEIIDVCNSGRLSFIIFLPQGETLYSTNVPLNPNTWYHIVATYDAQNLKIYINGSLVLNQNTIPIPNVNGLLNFGASISGNSQYLSGKLDDISLHNRALTATEVQQLYTLGQSTCSWSTGATTATINVTPTTTTTYTCAVTDANGNVCTDSVTVFVPQIEATDLTICAGETTTLSVSGINSTVTPSACPTLPTNLQTGLVGYWPFCGNANDASGNGNNGTVNGATLTTDRFGNANSAYSFDGVNDFISLTPSFFNNGWNNYSISVWISISQLNQIHQTIYNTSPHDGEVFSWNHSSNISKFTFWKNPNTSAGGWNIFYSAPFINNDVYQNVWTNFVITKEDNNYRFYKNGQIDHLSNSSIQALGNYCSINLGSVMGNSEFFNGSIDDFTIFERTLSASEIQQLYTLGQTTYLWSNGATTPSINVSPTSTITYTCTVTNNGVSCTDSVTVVVSNPVIDLGADVTVCGTSTTLTAPSGFDSYLWSNGGTTNTTTVSANGTYSCAVTQGGCSATDAIDVSLVDATISAIDSVLCASQSTTLSVNAIPSAAYNPALFPNQVEFNGHFYSKYTGTANWFDAKSICESNGGYLAIPNSIGATNFIRNLSGVEQAGYAYTWMGMSDDANEGNWIDVQGNPVTVFYWAPGEPNNENNEDFGLIYSQASGLGLWNDGHSIHLLPFVMERNSMPVDVLWSTGETTPTINVSPTTTTTYTCTVTTNGVSCIDSVTVAVNNPVIDLGTDVTVCGTSTTLTAPSGYDSYLWSNGGTTNTTTVTANGTYTCTVTQGGCSATDSIDVTLIDATITASDTTICAGETVTLSVPQGGSTNTACAALPTNLQTGLVGYWPFCGNANDASGNGNNGTVNGATLTTDRFGNANSAYSFDGNDFVTISDAILSQINGQSNLTINFWFNASSVEDGCIWGHWSNNNGQVGANCGLATMYYSGKLYASNYSGCCYFASNTISNFLSWHQATIVFDSNEPNNQRIKIFIDGILNTAETGIANLPIGNASSLFFGRRNTDFNTYGDYYSGLLDDFSTWNRSLTNPEIQQLYTLGQTTYSWSNGPTTPTINVSPTSTTTYICTVTTNGVSCTDSVTVIVSNPVIDLGADVTVCGTSTTLTAPSGYESYLWSNGGTTNTTTVSSNGTYSCTVTQGGCSATDAIEVTLVNVTVSATDTTICAGENTTLAVSVNNVPLNNNGNTILYSTTLGLNSPWIVNWPVTQGGNYELKVSGTYGIANGSIGFDAAYTISQQLAYNQSCTGYQDTWLLQDGCPMRPNPDVFNTNHVYYYQILNSDGSVDFSYSDCCFGDNSGALSFELTELNSSSYVWSNGATTPTINVSPTSTTTYTCTITTNGVSCTDSVTVVVSQPAASITPNGIVEICQGQSIALTANGGTSYLWNTGAPTQSITVNTEGLYTVTATDANGCTDTESQFVKVNFLPNIGVNNASICPGQSTTLTATGGLSYVWSPATGLSSTTGTTVTASPSTSTVYTVTGTGANGCTNTATAAVAVNAAPTATVTPATATTFCQGGSVVLNANTGTGLTYQWRLNGTNITGATSSSYTASASGTYTVVVTNTSTCSSTSTATVVTVNALPTATITPATAITFCQGGSVVLNANTGTGLTYQWFNNATAISGATSASYTATTSGSYTVVVTNTSTCSATSTATVVTVNALPTSTITPATATTFCQGGSVVLNANTGAGLTYQWFNNATAISGATSASYTATTNGSYTVVVTNTSTCSATSTATVVTVNALPTATITPATATTFCQGGSVVLNANTGTGLLYQWFNNAVAIGGATSSSYTANASGSYTVVVTNTSTCSSTSTATVVTVNALPTATITPATATTFCQGGSVVLNANTGTGLSYQWRLNGTNITGATSSSYTANASGSYTVVVTNTSTCSATSTATVVTVNTLPTATITASTATTFCQGGSVVLTANTGAGLSYQWFNNTVAISGATSSSYTANASGSYTVVVTNTSTCSATSTATVVTVNALPVAIISPNGLVEICQGQSIALTANGGVTYLWSTGAPTQSITVNTEALYTVTVTDINGCTDTESQFVKVNQLPNIGVNNASICAGQSATLTATGGLSYVWSPATGLSGTTGSTVSSSTTTNTMYTVTGTGANGCTNSATATVTVNALPTATINAATTTTFCQGGSVVLNANTDAGLTYQWFNNANAISGAISASYTATTSGSYTVTVTNASTCSATSSAIDVTTIPNIDYYADTDGDGYGDVTTLLSTCVQPQGYVTDNTDCDDTSADVNPVVVEVCNHIDDDCSGTIDDGLVFNTYYADVDGDTFGDANNSIYECSQPNGYVINNTDCNDNNANQNTASTEICNSEDDDCDGAIDNGLIFLDYYADLDSDGFGAGAATNSCVDLGAGYVTNNTDCNNANALINPNATEICNSFDDNCNGQIDEGITFTTYYQDFDNDGFGTGTAVTSCTNPGAGWVTNNTDCDDTNGNTFPGATELCNTIDDNCDGLTDDGTLTVYFIDNDGDSYGNPSVSILACTQPIGYTPDDNDCNDTDANINPGAEDIGGNGIDENCDGEIDNSIFELNASISLYPNPTRSELNIQVNSNIIGNDLCIFDAVGKLVFKQQLLSTQTTIPVSNFADGNYVVRVGEVVKRFEVMK